MSAERDELAEYINDIATPVPGGWQIRAADAADVVLKLGYRKPRIIGYVVVSRDGCIITATVYKDRNVAQATADEWTNDCKAGGVDWDYRVAGISEAAA